MHKILLTVLCLFSFITAENIFGVINGNVSNLSPLTANEAYRATASLYAVRSLNISIDSTNIKVSTKYGLSWLLVQFYNNTDSVRSVKFRLQYDTAHITLKIPAYSVSFKLPPVDSLYWVGTSDSLILNFQRR